MADDQKMYYILFDASKRAISHLIQAQRQAEELYLEESAPCVPFPSEKDGRENSDFLPEDS